MLKKILGWLAIAFLAYYVVKNPSGAAATAHHIGTGLASAAGSLGDFFTALVGGGQ
jgi:hypothetical protein